MHARRRLIVPRGLVGACEEEARRLFPRETGGVFMGREAGGDLFVEHLIGPGPDADHRLGSFEPDAAHQWEEMSRIHRATVGQARYLGDWHTHPRCRDGRLSRMDVEAIGEILRDPRSLVDDVVFAILSGGRARWRWTAHSASLASRATVIGPCEVLAPR